MSTSKYSLYVVRCADDSLYTGIALDVVKRMQEHESGSRGAKFLRGRGPLRLVFKQTIGDRSLATKIELRVKRLSRLQKDALISGDFSLADLLQELDSEKPQAAGESCG